MKSEKKSEKKSGFIHTSFRASQAMLDRIDAIAEVIQQRQVGKVTRADMFRQLLADGVIRYETSILGKASPKVDP
jgi:hypothetical protein